jgi:hypothetical protein
LVLGHPRGVGGVDLLGDRPVDIHDRNVLLRRLLKLGSTNGWKDLRAREWIVCLRQLLTDENGWDGGSWWRRR